MNQATPAVLHTPGFAQYNVAWSPFHTTRIAVASSANYGIVGNGRLHIASTFQSPSGMASVKLDKLYAHWPLQFEVKLMQSYQLRNTRWAVRPRVVRGPREPARHCVRRRFNQALGCDVECKPLP